MAWESSLRRGSDRRLDVLLLSALLVAVLLLGGGSRGDIVSLVILRPLAALIAALAIVRLKPGDLGPYRFLVVMLAMLAAIMLIQLVPLPPNWWHALPMRQGIAEIDGMLGLHDLRRPLTLSPAKTLNSLASLLVPAAFLLLYACQPRETRRAMPAVFLAFACLSAVIGLVQLAQGPDSPLYSYAITNRGEAVGLFANRNHQAVFMACGLAFIPTIWARYREVSWRPGLVMLLLGAAVLLVASLLINPSRAGLLTGALMTAYALYRLLVEGRCPDANQAIERRGTGSQAWRHATIRMAAVAAPLILALAFLFAGRIPALDRLAGNDPLDDTRAQVLPTLLKMAGDHFALGTGFGSFEHVYRSYEPDALMNPSYLNNAHNDLLQLVIEGGSPAILIAVSLAVWIVQRIGRARKDSRPLAERSHDWQLGAALLAALVLASAVDYPLRVPLMMVLGSFAIMQFASPHGSRLGRRSSGTVNDN